MDNDIEIKIKHHYIGVTAIFVVSTVAAVFSFGYMVVTFQYERYIDSLLNAMVFIMSGVVSVLSAVISHKPTVIRSDGTMLYWQFIYRKRELSLNDIVKTTCYPYSVHGRYETQQRISLTICLKDGAEIEFNDCVDANDLLEEKLGNKRVDIPIMKLYKYLKAHCGESDN